ncbi:MAG: tRNA (adenosine(37)-N6)-dimethylallyltransferase MiaA [Desulfobacterales bacterium]|nr:tRNA (adenosine(37)-N6)-dimethylallyltransferase MiaA [Desulfobacterales bacterium]
MKKIISICGPTGIGKTSFAISLAQKFDGEIIGADSMQIYKYLDIGTAKPDAEELAAAVHHLVDFLDPDLDYDAGQYAADADAIIQDLYNKDKLPIVAGGTGFYIRALLHGLFRSKPADAQMLEQITREWEERGGEALHKELASCDPVSAERIHPNDAFRVIRAIEVFRTTGKPISKKQEDHGFAEQRYESLTFGLTMDRARLYDRINRRVDIMMEQGLLNEVVQLQEKGYSLDLKSMQCIGYRHMGMYLKGEVSLDEAVELLKRDTRRYAKRQFTWFRKEPGLIWIEPTDMDGAAELVEKFLNGK